MNTHRNTATLKIIGQVPPTVRGKTQLKGLHGFLVNSAIGQIPARRGGFAAGKILLIVIAGQFVGGKHLFATPQTLLVG